MNNLLRLLILSLFLATPAFAQETVRSGPDLTTELWEGRTLTAHFRVGICYRPDGHAQGVLVLKHRSGNEDIYHLYGTLKNNEFYLSHSSGHRISGKLTAADKMEGKARLSSGLKLSLSGSRHLNAPVLAADCAPVPN